ncbi:hypothetical protein FRC09_005114, partial [Ceratobasidium sp. 395]
MAAMVSSAAATPNPTLKQRLFMLVGSSRPVCWLFGPISYIAGTIHSGAIPSSLLVRAISLGQMAALSFPLCIVLFGINDVYDYPSDLVNPRKSGTLAEGIVLPPVYHGFVIRAAIVSSTTIISASCLPYISAASVARPWQAGIPAVSTATLIAIAWMYSAPPFRLKERPMIDSLSNALMVWLAWFIGFTSSSTLTGVMRGLKDVPLEVNMLALVATGVHALGAAADIEADKSAGYKTVATVLGRQLCAVYGAMV